MQLAKKWVDFHQERINRKNRNRLTNPDISIVASNCAGGFLYHWLGLEFKSPFINLYLSNDDFLEAMENLDAFLEGEIVEDTQNQESYPVGVGFHGIRLNFMHYKTFDEAMTKWNARKTRLLRDKMCVMLTNWNGEERILERFEKLPYQNKIAFVNKPFPQYPSAFYVKNYDPEKNGTVNTIWRLQNKLTGKRYIDQFDYVQFFNQVGRDTAEK